MNTKKKNLTLPFIALLGLLFNWFFWEEKPGLNYLLFTGAVIGILSYLDFLSLKRTNTLLSLGCLVLCTLGIVFVNSTLSIWMYFISLMIFLAFYHQKGIRSIYYAIAASFANLALHYPTTFSLFETSSEKEESKAQKFPFKKLSLLIIPIVITCVFFLIYSQANPMLGEYADQLFKKISQQLEQLFQHFSFLRILFLFVGLAAGSFIISSRKLVLFSNKEKLEGSVIYRRNQKKQAFSNILDLLNEYRIAFATFLMLNVLLLLVNALDVLQLSTFSFSENAHLADDLHKGTFLLIISILLSIGVLVYFFRGNLNFIKDSKKIKPLAHAWIAQNFILALLVGIKCFIYIHFHGLGYKRIGVLIFLLIVTAGLTMMFVKIKKRKSVYYLLRKTSWVSLLVLSICSLVNLDGIILKTNLNHEHPELIDHSFLLNLSDKSIPTLIENISELEKHNAYCINNYNVKYKFRGSQLTTLLDRKINDFKESQEEYSWLSWNYADHSTAEYLKNSTYTVNQ